MWNPLCGPPLHTYDGIPQGDPLSTLIFVAATTLAISGALGDGTAVPNVSYIDDMLFTGVAEDVADAHDMLAAQVRPTGLELQPVKTKVWPRRRTGFRQSRVCPPGQANPSGGGLLILGEALGEYDEEAQVLGLTHSASDWTRLPEDTTPA